MLQVYVQCLGCRSKYASTQNHSAAHAIWSTCVIVVGFPILFVHLQIRVDICTVLPASLTRLTPTFLVGDPPGI